jgi:hypothetical protein
MAQERAFLLATSDSEVDRVAQRFSILGGELVATRQAYDAIKEKILNPATKAAAAER